MPDIFGRTITLGPTISGDLLRVTFGNDQGGMLVEQVQIQQERSLDVNMDIGTGKLYTLLAIPRPYTAAFQGLIADVDTFKSFLQSYATGCTEAPDLDISITNPICGTPAQVISYTLKVPRIINHQHIVNRDRYIYVATVVLSGPAIEITS